MSFNNLSSMTPSRPAPTPPLRPNPSSANTSYRNTSGGSSSVDSKNNSAFSSTAYSSSFPILNPSSALGPPPVPTKNAVVRTGPANVKEEGLRSFLWSKRWLVLGSTDLQIFKNEVGCSLSRLQVSLNNIAIILRHVYLQPCRCGGCPTRRSQTVLRRT